MNIKVDIDISELEGKITNLINEKFNTPKEPDVYINTSEACRLLEVTPPTIMSFSKEGLLKEHFRSNNKYLLAEILWLRDRNYRNLGVEKFNALIKEKKEQFV